jgi:hypothetical protein
MAGYSRQDTANNIANGNVIDADDLDNEFNAVEDAFNSTNGHAHDGTPGEGAPITKVGPSQDIIVGTSNVLPKSNNTIDLGSDTARFKDVYIDGTAYLDTINAGVNKYTTIGDNSYAVSSGNFTVDVAGDINLDADGGDVVLQDGGVTYASFNNNANDLIIKSGTTTAATFSGANVDFAGTLAATGSATFDSTVNIVGDTAITSGDLTVNTGNVNIGGALGVTGTITGDLDGNAATATALETARTIGGVSFDGTANINLPGVNAAGNQNTSGNAATATALETARTIGGVSFDGTSNINLPGVNTAGNQNTSGNAATATKLATPRNITLSGDVTGSASFDGSANASITAVIADDSHNHVISNVDGLQTALDGKAPTGRTISAGGGLTGGGSLAANRTISHADTSSVGNVNNSGNTFIQDLTFDGYGHVTAVASGTVSVNNATITISGGSGLSGSAAFTTNQGSNETITISHANTSNQASVNNSGSTYIQDITLDTYGHVTSLSSATVSFPAPTTAQVGTATASLAVGSVGSYAFLYSKLSSTYGAGTTVAGSDLGYSNAAGATLGAPAGTWRSMGAVTNVASTTTRTTVFLRIS